MRMAADVDPPPIPVHQPGRVQGLRITAASRSQVWCRLLFGDNIFVKSYLFYAFSLEITFL